MGAKVFIVATP